MLLVSIILAFAALALGLLTLLDRYETAVDKSHADRRVNKAPKVIYYDAFANRRQTSAHVNSIIRPTAAAYKPAQTNI